jgi:multicomponent Na+:H+ antiporter subunit A
VLAVGATAGLVRAGRAVELNALPWDGPLALVLHVDALSVLFALMGTGLGAFVLLYSIGYMAHDKAVTRFFALMLLFIGGFVGLVYSANLFILYLCWEVVGLCSFSLVGFWYTNPESVHGARKVLLMTHIAGYGLLAAILVVFHRTGSALWTDPKVASAFTGGVFVLMLIALIAKSVQFPLHTWIPDAMAAPTPVSALLHSACYVTSGVYLAARMHCFGQWPQALGQPWGNETLMWVGTVTMAVGVMYAMVQSDLKRMLAFSTVSQIGYMMMGIGIGSSLAITAGLLHCLNHGFFKGGLFLGAGSVQHASGTRDMNQLGGLAQKMPHTTLSWLINIGSMMGLPLMSGFASKWMLYTAALQAGWTVPAMVAWAASLGTVFLGAKSTSAVFLGPLTDATKDAHESPPTMLWGMGFLAAGSVVLGIAPQLAVNYLLNPILGAMKLEAVQVTWFGLSGKVGWPWFHSFSAV